MTAHSGRAFRSEQIGGILEPTSPGLAHGLDKQRQIALAGPGFHRQRPGLGLIELERGQPFFQQNKHHLTERLMSWAAFLDRHFDHLFEGQVGMAEGPQK